MKRFFLITISLLFIFVSHPSFAAEMTYPHKITVDKINFQWSLDADAIHIKLSAETTGWVGIGFNPTDKMKDANFVIGYVKNGKVNVKDQFGSGITKHDEDVKSGGKDNLTNVSGKESGGMTEIAFTLPLNSGDKHDQVINPDGDTTVLLAYASGMDSFFIKHKFRTRLSVNLSTGSFKQLKD